MRIKYARITAQPKKIFDAMPKVYATTEDDKEHFLFEYYPDELSFTAEEFTGLTIEEAHTLKFNKDRAYLLSS